MNFFERWDGDLPVDGGFLYTEGERIWSAWNFVIGIVAGTYVRGRFLSSVGTNDRIEGTDKRKRIDYDKSGNI